MGELFQMTWVFQNRNEMDPEIQILLNNLRVFNCMWMINVQCSWPRECRCTRGMGSMAAGESNEIISCLVPLICARVPNPQSSIHFHSKTELSQFKTFKFHTRPFNHDHIKHPRLFHLRLFHSVPSYPQVLVWYPKYWYGTLITPALYFEIFRFPLIFIWTKVHLLLP
jgi:hypothetical protein